MSTTPTYPPPPPPPQGGQYPYVVYAVAPQPAPAAAAPPQQTLTIQCSGQRKPMLRRVLGTLVTLAIVLAIGVYVGLLMSSMNSKAYETHVLVEGSEDATIVVYEVKGVITDATAGTFSAFTRDALKNDKIKAIVLRVDSPGGGVTPSDQIHSDIVRLRDEGRKKIIVSMGAVAASGGYYISAPADRIFAEHTTITGSIGVIMEWFIARGTLDKIGVEPMILKSTHARDWKDELSFTQKPNDRQRAHLQAMLDTMQARFEKIVREGRKDRLHERPAADLPPATAPVEMLPTELHTRVELPEGAVLLLPSAGPITSVPAVVAAPVIAVQEIEPFNGKIYMGDEARTLGLVDEIGYLDAAIEAAKDATRLRDPKIVEVKPRTGFLTWFFYRTETGPLGITQETIDNLQTPKMLMQWKVN